MNIIPWLVLGLVVALGTTGQLALKYALGAAVDRQVSDREHRADIKPKSPQLLRSVYFWIWFVCYVSVTGLWLFVLRSIPLSQAFPALGLTFALIPIGSHYILGERVVFSQWVGIATICAGAMLVIRT
jgi:undecaprenyl phosphate-alpha-L-ara4N flippase subunit ArnE